MTRTDTVDDQFSWMDYRNPTHTLGDLNYKNNIHGYSSHESNAASLASGKSNVDTVASQQTGNTIVQKSRNGALRVDVNVDSPNPSGVWNGMTPWNA